MESWIQKVSNKGFMLTLQEMIPWTDQRLNLLLIFTFYFKYLKYKIIFNLVIETVLYLKYNRINPFTAVYNARNTLGEIRLFWCYYGVTYNFIQNHNHCRDLHQIFSCLFETFGSMSEIMFSSDSMSKIFFSTAENTWISTFVYNIIVLEWLGNNGSKMWEWQEFPPLPLLIPININCHL